MRIFIDDKLSAPIFADVGLRAQIAAAHREAAPPCSGFGRAISAVRPGKFALNTVRGAGRRRENLQPTSRHAAAIARFLSRGAVVPARR